MRIDEDKLVLDLGSGQTFEVETLKVCENKFLAEGFYYSEIWPEKATLSGECESKISSSSDLIKTKITDWVVDTDYNERIYTMEDICNVLGVTVNKAWRLVQDVFPDPHKDDSGKDYWLVNEVLCLKPFINKKKIELLRYIIRKEF